MDDEMKRNIKNIQNNYTNSKFFIGFVGIYKKVGRYNPIYMFQHKRWLIELMMI